jgi:ketosteroid isomerase-like protein
MVGPATLFALSAACGSQQRSVTTSPDVRAEGERAIRALSLEWAKAYGAKDLEKTLSFYADDAWVYPPNQPIATSGEQRRKLWVESFALPGFALTSLTTRVEVSRAGDLGYETGSYQLTVQDQKGKPTTSQGKYVVVWKKQADGAWKGVEDIWSADRALR